MQNIAKAGALGLGISLGVLAGAAHGQFNRLNATATSAGSGSDSAIDFFDPVQAQAGGTVVNEETRTTTTIISSAFGRAEFGYGRVSSTISGQIVQTGNLFNSVTRIGQVTSGSDSRDAVRFRWAEGFDSTQPIDVTLTGRVVVPTGQATLINPGTDLTVTSRFNFQQSGGLAINPGENNFNFDQTLSTIDETPTTRSTTWTVSDGSELNFSTTLDLRLNIAVGISVTDPSNTLLETNISALAFWQLYIDVPDGVEMVSDSQHDYTRRVIPGAPVVSVFVAAGICATRRRRG